MVDVVWRSKTSGNQLLDQPECSIGTFAGRLHESQCTQEPDCRLLPRINVRLSHRTHNHGSYLHSSTTVCQKSGQLREQVRMAHGAAMRMHGPDHCVATPKSQIFDLRPARPREACDRGESCSPIHVDLRAAESAKGRN